MNESKDKAKICVGSPFGPNGVFLSWGFIPVSIIMFWANSVMEDNEYQFFGYVIASVFFVGGVLGVTTKQFVEFDKTNNELFDYYKVFGLFKTGKREPLDTWKAITVLSMNRKVELNKSVIRISAVSSYNYKSLEVYLLNDTHRRRSIIKKAKNMQVAIESAETVSNLLGLPIQDFNPQRISERR